MESCEICGAAGAWKVSFYDALAGEGVWKVLCVCHLTPRLVEEIVREWQKFEPTYTEAQILTERFQHIDGPSV